MIQQLVTSIEPSALIINFFCHLTMFFGGLYIAIHSRLIPNWIRTFLWYIGCSSFLIAITIILGWVFGDQYELSYSSVGVIGETLFNIWVSIMTLAFFYKTIISDIRHSKNR